MDLHYARASLDNIYKNNNNNMSPSSFDKIMEDSCEEGTQHKSDNTPEHSVGNVAKDNVDKDDDDGLSSMHFLDGHTVDKAMELLRPPPADDGERRRGLPRLNAENSRQLTATLLEAAARSDEFHEHYQVCGERVAALEEKCLKLEEALGAKDAQVAALKAKEAEFTQALQATKEKIAEMESRNRVISNDLATAEKDLKNLEIYKQAYLSLMKKKSEEPVMPSVKEVAEVLNKYFYCEENGKEYVVPPAIRGDVERVKIFKKYVVPYFRKIEEEAKKEVLKAFQEIASKHSLDWDKLLDAYHPSVEMLLLDWDKLLEAYLHIVEEEKGVASSLS